MALILAIEADRRQAGYLAQIVSRRLGAELIVAETFEGALQVLGNRVPDLILVPALLSPEDDASLKFVLRVIAGTSHVQVLTTPTFAPSGTKRASGRVLPRFLRSRADRAVDGCDQDEFANHIASYLHTAQEQRVAPELSLGPPLPEPVELLPVARNAVVEEPVFETPPQAEAVVDAAPEVAAAPEVESSLDRLVADLAARFAAARAVAAAEVTAAPGQDPPVKPPAIEPGASQSGSNEWGLFDPRQSGIEALLVKVKEESGR